MVRTKVGERRVAKQVVAGLILRAGGPDGREVLICQRTKHQSMPLKWEFPGGKIEAGEQPKQALKRELEEELGIEATIGDQIADIRHRYPSGSTIELRFYLVLGFKGELENRIFKQIVWALPSDLPRYDFLEADISFVQQIAAGKLLQG